MRLDRDQQEMVATVSEVAQQAYDAAAASGSNLIALERYKRAHVNFAHALETAVVDFKREIANA